MVTDDVHFAGVHPHWDANHRIVWPRGVTEPELRIDHGCHRRCRAPECDEHRIAFGAKHDAAVTSERVDENSVVLVEQLRVHLCQAAGAGGWNLLCR